MNILKQFFSKLQKAICFGLDAIVDRDLKKKMLLTQYGVVIFSGLSSPFLVIFLLSKAYLAAFGTSIIQVGGGISIYWSRKGEYLKSRLAYALSVSLSALVVCLITKDTYFHLGFYALICNIAIFRDKERNYMWFVWFLAYFSFIVVDLTDLGPYKFVFSAQTKILLHIGLASAVFVVIGYLFYLFLKVNELSETEIIASNENLQDERDKISSLLDNMQQAVFVMDEEGTVIPPVSLYCETIFNRSIENENVYQIVYGDIDPKSQDYSLLRTTLSIVFDADQLQWDLMEEHLPRQVTFENGSKILRLSYAPIWNKTGLMEKLMLIAEDVTEITRLQEKVTEERNFQKRQFQIVTELMKQQDSDEVRSTLIDILSSVNKFQIQMRELSSSPELRGELLRGLHTLKGNARLLGFRLIAEVTHVVETIIIEICVRVSRAQIGIQVKPDDLDRAALELKRIEDQVQEYYAMGDRVFRWDGKQEIETYAMEIPLVGLKRLEAGILELEHGRTEKNVALIKQSVNRLKEVPVKPALLLYQRMIQEVSVRLGKEIEYEVKADGVTLPKHVLSTLREAFTHLLRNAIDHGIESPQDREKVGKPRCGLILVESDEVPGLVRFTIQDDGKGIDAKMISELSVKKGLKTSEQVVSMSEEDKLALIFLPQFSTREEVSEISGRGIGADVAKTNVEKLGGKIHISTQLGRGTIFLIEIPSTNL